MYLIKSKACISGILEFFLRGLKKSDKNFRTLCLIAAIILDTSLKLQKINQLKYWKTRVSEILYYKSTAHTHTQLKWEVENFKTFGHMSEDV